MENITDLDLLADSTAHIKTLNMLDRFSFQVFWWLLYLLHIDSIKCSTFIINIWMYNVFSSSENSRMSLSFGWLLLMFHSV